MDVEEDTHKKLSSQEFSSALGNAVWLMTMSKKHRDLPIREVEYRIAPALLLRQFRFFHKKKQPVAFLTWAGVSHEVELQLNEGGKLREISDWRSGPTLKVIDCISPFVPASTFIEKFVAYAAKTPSTLN